MFSLYDTCHWEDKAIRKLVGDGKIAARLRGTENRTSDSDRECPICFLHYSEINVTKCCHANICSECYLQVRPQKEKSSTCPFCNNQKLQITIAKRMEEDQIHEREAEEQRLIEARIRERATSGAEDDTGKSSTESEFGSSLAQNDFVAMMRSRSESFASSEENSNPNILDDTAMIQSLAMTPEERRRLEDQMRAQHSHPLALRVEAEAAERRLENERGYYRTHSGSLRDARAQRAAEMLRASGGVPRRNRTRGSGGRDWNQIVDAFERGGNGEVHSIDDLVVLEAAILLSMEEEARRARSGEDPSSFDAARHARDGFPLVRSFLAARGEEGVASNEQLQSMARHLGNSRRSRRSHLLRGRTTGDTTLDTAALLMRGLTEEDQLAMAIAASLQEQTNSQTTSSTGESEDGRSEQGGVPADSSADSDMSVSRDAMERAVVGIMIDEEDDNRGNAQLDDEEQEGGAEDSGIAIGVEMESNEEAESNAGESNPLAVCNSDVDQTQMDANSVHSNDLETPTMSDEVVPEDDEFESQAADAKIDTNSQPIPTDVRKTKSAPSCVSSTSEQELQATD